MDEYPKKHAFENLYTLEERRILDWPESSLQPEIPPAIREMAIDGVSLHPFFEGKQVWFWDRNGLRAILDFLDNYNRDAELEKQIWPLYYDQYAIVDGQGQFDQGTNFGYCGSPGATEFIRQLYLEEEPDFSDTAYWLLLVYRHETARVPLLASSHSGKGSKAGSWVISSLIAIAICLLLWKIGSCIANPYAN